MNIFEKDRSTLFAAALMSAACLAAGWTSLALEYRAGTDISWRPSAGILLGVLLTQPRHRWWTLLAAAWPVESLLAHLYHSPLSFWACLLLGSVHVISAAIGARSMDYFAPGPVRFERLRDVCCLILFPCAILSLIAACIEVVITPHAVSGAAAFTDGFRWWVRDWLGYFILAPAVVTGFDVMHGWKRNVDGPRVWRAAGLHAGVGVAAWFAFSRDRTEWVGPFPLIYLPFPALVWAALRFGPGGASGCSLVLAAMVSLQTAVQTRQWEPQRTVPRAQVRLVQLYLLVSSSMTLLLAAVIRERENASRALEDSEQRYRQLADNLRQAEKEVRKTEDVYRRAITAASAVPYLREYGKPHFTFIGEGIHELTGYTAAEMTPELWEILAMENVMWGEVAGLSYEEAVRKSRAGELKNWQSDSLIVTRQGTQRWLSDSSVEFFDKDGKAAGSIGILMDVTDRKRAEEAMRLANAGLEGRILERTSELESAVRELEGFTYSVSHDLRAPLRAIEGFSRILQEDHASALGEEPASLLNRVRSAAVRMDVLINNLLAFSRLSRQPLSRQNTDLNPFVREALEELRLEPQSRQIQVKHDPLPSCFGDPELLRQVVRIFISNAVKYTRSRTMAVIEIGSDTSAGEIAYYVRDNGTGFDMAYADKLFGVFQRLHRSEDFEGTGVGLAIAQRIIRRHGGRIWAAAEVDRGATFFFTLGSTSTSTSSTSASRTPTEPASTASTPLSPPQISKSE